MAVSAIAGLVSAVAGGIATGFALGTFLTSFAIGAGLSMVSRALAPKPNIGEQMRGLTQTTRNPADTRKIIYGKMRVGGNVVFIAHSGSDNKYLHLAVVFATHRITAYDEVWFNDNRIWTAAGGFQGDWGTYVTMDTTKLGTAGQTASTVLTPITEWTANHKLSGIAYIAFKLEWNQDKFPQGVPNITAVIRGKPVFDPRTDVTGYSTNPALCLRDYMLDQDYGLGESNVNIDSTALEAAADLCDEQVSLNAGGTQDRYQCNGVIDTANQIKANIEQLLASMGGKLTYSGGKYFVDGAEYKTPTHTFTEADVISEIQTQTKQSRRGIYNGVKGIFVSEEKNYKVLDYPAQISSTYATEDGDPLYLDMPLPFVTNNLQAQRLAKIALLKSRQQVVITMTVNLKGLQIKVGDTIQVTNDRLGYSSKVFEVIDYSLAIGDGQALAVNLVCIETASAIYDWTTSDEADFLSGGELDLYDGRTVDNVTSLTLTEIGLRGPDGGVSSSVQLAWTAPDDAFIEFYKIRYNKNGTTDYFEVQSRETNVLISGLDITSNYDFRVQAENLLGVTSTGTTLSNQALNGDTTAPSAPTGGAATGGIQTITAEWTNPSDIDFKHVEVFVNTSDSIPASPTAVVDGEEYVVTGLSGAVTRYFWLKAVDFSGNKSAATASFNGTSVVAGSTDIADDAIGADEINDDEVLHEVPSEGLTYYWPCNSIADVSGSGNEELQEVVAGKTGIHSGSTAPTLSTDSPTGKSIVNGTDNSGWTLLSDTDADALEGANGFAWSLWFKSDTTSGDGAARIIGRDASDGWAVVIDQSASGNQAVTLYGEPSTEAMGSLAQGEWHHFCLSEDGNGTISGYVNGELVSTESYTPVDSSRPVVIACNTETAINTASSVFEGKLTEIRAYNRALTAQEVRGLYKVPAASAPAEVDGDMIIDGSLVAAKITVANLAEINDNVGTITGGSVGGVTITSTKLYQGTGTFNNSNTGFYLDNTGQFSLKDKLSFNGTTLSVSGAITATSLTLSGTSIAESQLASGVQSSLGLADSALQDGDTSVNLGLDDGSIAGINITSTKLYAGTGDWGNSNTGFYLDNTGKFSLKDKIFFNPSNSLLTVDGNITADIITAKENLVVLGDLEASSMAAGSITRAMFSQDALDEIYGALATSVGGSNGDYKEASGNFTTSGGTVTVGTSSDKFDHGTADVVVEFLANHYFYATTNYTTAQAQATLNFEVSADGTFTDLTSATKTQTLQFEEYDLSSYYGTTTLVYSFNGEHSKTFTTGSGNDIPDSTELQFRVRVTGVGTAFTGQTVPFTVEANEGVTGVVSTGGNADTLDNLDSTKFLRSDVNDTFDADLTITGDLSLQGALNITGDINSYNVTDLDVTDKTITVNSGNTQSLSDGAGLIVDRGTASDASLTWDETNDKFDFSHPVQIQKSTIGGELLHLRNSYNGGYRDDLIIENTNDRDAGLTIKTAGGQYEMWVDSNGDDSLIFSAGDNTTNITMELYQNKNVDIGGDLDVTGEIDTSKGLTFNPNGYDINGDSDGNRTLFTFTRSGAASWQIWHNANQDLNFIPNNTSYKLQWNGNDLLYSGANISVGTISSGAITSSTGTSSFYELTLTGDSDDLTFTTTGGDWSILNAQQSNGLVIYDGTSGVTVLYNNAEVGQFDNSGFDVVSGALQVGGTTRISSAGAGTFTDVTLSDISPEIILSDTNSGGGGGAFGRILFQNTAGNAIGIGYTPDSIDDSDLIISTNAAGTYGGYMSLDAAAIADTQADIILEPKTNVRIATGGLKIGTTTFVDSSRNITAGTISSGAITSTGRITSDSSDIDGFVLENSAHRSGVLNIPQRDAADSYTGIMLKRDDDDRWAVMASDTLFGIYDDINDDWALQASELGGVRLYYAGAGKLETLDDGVQITGRVTAAATNIDNAYNFQFTDSDADNSYSGMRIDYNASDNTTLTADRNHIAFEVDYDVTSTGGDTSNEYRAYGISVDVRGSGDTDIRRGIYSYSETQHSAGTVSENIAIYGYAVADETGTGRTTNNYGGYFLAFENGTGTGGTATHYGVFSKAQATSAADKNIGSMYGVYSEVEYDTTGATTAISTIYGVSSIIDNDSTDTTVTNSYLFHGSYQGTINATNAYGLYISGNVENYFAGHVRADQGYKVGSSTIIDASANMSNIGTIGSTGDITVTNGSFNLSSGYNIQWGGSYSSGFPTIFANSSQKVLRFAPNGSTTGTVLEIDSGGLDLKVGGYEIDGTTVIDSSSNITAGTISSGAITTSGTLDFTANPAYIRNDQDASGQIVISAKNSASQTQQVRWDAANNTAGAWRPETTNISDLGLTDKIWNTLYINLIKHGASNDTFLDQNRNVTANDVLVLGDLDIQNRLRHNGNTDTYIEFTTDQIDLRTTLTSRLTITDDVTVNTDLIVEAMSPSISIRDGNNGGSGNAEGKILFKNTGGNAIGIGYTADVLTDSDLIISTDAGGTYGAYLGLDALAITDTQSDIILEPKTSVRIASGGLKVGTTEVISSVGRFYSTSSTVTKPAFSFDGDSNTGMYHMGADQIGFTIGGSNKVYIEDNIYVLNVLGAAYINSDLDVAGDLAVGGNITSGGSTLLTSDDYDTQVCHLKTNVSAAVDQGVANEFTVNFNLEEHNDSTTFSHSSGVVTVATAGWYRIYANMVYQNGSASSRNTVRAYVEKNGTEITSTATYDYDRGSAYGEFSNNKIETMLYLAANDTIGIGNYAENEDGVITIEAAECEFIVSSVSATTSSTNADTVDGLHASSFIRSDASDTVSGAITFNSDVYVSNRIYHAGDTNTYLDFLDDRARIISGGIEMIDCVEGATDYVDIVDRVRVTAGGDLECEGNITAYTSTSISDINQKENIQRIESPIEKIKEISGYTFDWKQSGEHSGGVIAQEIEQVMPDIVKEKSIRDGEKMKAVDYQAIIGLLVETVKDLNKRIEDLENGDD